MSKISITPNAAGTGTFTITSPATNTDRTLTLPDAGGSVVMNEGSGTFKIDASGRVGIGTDSPNKLMHLKANTPVVNLHSDNASSAQISFTNSGGVSEQGFIKYEHDGDYSGNMQFRVAGAERLRIDASGNLLVGTTTSSDSSFSIQANGAGGRISAATGTNSNAFRFSNTNTTSQWSFGTNSPGIQNAGDYMAIGRLPSGGSWAEALRIDASGNLLVGKTSNSTITVGCMARADGLLASYREDDVSAIFARANTDGNIAVFRKDGTTVGSIGVDVGRPYFVGVSSGVAFGGTQAAIWPTNSSGVLTDNAYDIGSTGVRWDDIYATNGTIQTSDRSEKQDIEVLSDAEQRVAVACKGLLRKFRWKDAVAEKGDDARIHFGIIAQDLQAAFEAEGLDAGRYAMFISSTWTDEETGEERSRMGVRYPQLLAFIIAAI